MTPEAFRDLYLAYLKNAAPDLPVEIGDELEFKVGSSSGASHAVFLGNAYQQYLGSPEKRDEILDLYIGSFLDVINQQKASIDRARIVPVIKDRGWLDEIRDSLENRDPDADKLPGYLMDPYNSELAIFYAEDHEKNIQYLTNEAIEGVGIERDSLRGLAVENLRRLIPGIEVKGGDGLYMITAGGDYEASLLLLDFLWSPDTMPVAGDFVVAIPSRDLLIVTGSENREAISRLREMMEQTGDHLSYRLTPVLFVRREGAFEVFEG